MYRYRAGIDIGSTTVKLVILDDKDGIVFSDYRRHRAHTQETLAELLSDARKITGECELLAGITAALER